MTLNPNDEEIAKRAYENFLRRTPEGGSPEGDWLQAKGQLKREKLLDELRRWAEIAERISRLLALGSIVFTIFGARAMSIYLGRVQAPYPAIDSSLGIFLLFLGVSISVLLSIIALLLCLPFWVQPPYSDALSHVFQSFRDDLVINADKTRFAIDYIIYLLPYWFGVVGATVSTIPKLPEWFASSCFLLSMFGVGLLLEGLILKLKRFRIGEIILPLLASASTSFLSALWVYLMLLIPRGAKDLSWMSSGRVEYLTIAILILTHVILFAFARTLPKALCIVIIWIPILAFLYPGAPVVLASTLRDLGLGGGRPIAMRLKSAEKRGDATTGCLILMTSSQILFAPEPPGVDCKLQRYFTDRPLLSNISVEVLERSDVISVRVLAPGDLVCVDENGNWEKQVIR